MGLYVNPLNMGKEAWLLENAKKVAVPTWPPPEGTMLVCCIDNGPFRAALVAHNQKEFNYVIEHPDNRPKQWYSAPTDKLVNATPGLADVI